MDSLGNKASAVGALSPGCAHGEAAWASLTEDGCAFVLTLGEGGAIAFASEGVRELLAGVPGFREGATLEQVFGREFAAERLDAAAKARSTNHAVRLLGMMNGVLVTETYRALKPGTPAAATLLTARPVGVEGDFPGLASGERQAAKVNHFGPLSGLTERELELLHHIGMGRTSDETAKLMHRSTRTVEWHRASLGQKLGCDNRVQLARIAVRSGLNAVSVEFIRDLYRSGAKSR